MAIYRCTPLPRRRRTFRDTRTQKLPGEPAHSDCSGRILHSVRIRGGWQAHVTSAYSTNFEQTNSGASHFKPTKSRSWPSEAVRAKSDSTVCLIRPNSTGPPRFATIRDRRRVHQRVTDIRQGRRKRGLAYYSNRILFVSLNLSYMYFSLGNFHLLKINSLVICPESIRYILELNFSANEDRKMNFFIFQRKGSNYKSKLANKTYLR